MCPIRNLTHQTPSFPEIGQLRKGDPKPNEHQPGKDLTYFRFTTDIGEVATTFQAAYDGEPRLINVFLPFAAVDDNMNAWQEEYRAGGLVHRCDGETAVLWQKPDGTYSHEPRPCEYAAGTKPRTDKVPGCKAVGRLKVIIPELGRLAYVTVLTTSINDIRNLDAQLRALAGLRDNHDLRGIPLQLRRRPHRISTPGQNGKRVRREKWLLSIEAAPDWVSLQLASQREAALPIVRQAALPAPGVALLDAAPDADEWEEDTVTVEDVEWEDVPEELAPEPEPAPPPPDCTLVEVPAGKFAHKTLGWLLKNEQSYLEWIAGSAQDKNIKAAAAATLRWAGVWPKPEPAADAPF